MVLLNMLFFNSIFFGMLIAEFVYMPSGYGLRPSILIDWIFGMDWQWMVLVIFLYNLLLGSFLWLTVTGFIFFPLSAVLLAIRGTSWGIMLNQSSPAISPLVIILCLLEGEGYIVSSLAGVLLGLSWLKNDWLFGIEKFSRREAVKTAAKETLYLYVLVAAILFVSALFEASIVALARI